MRTGSILYIFIFCLFSLIAFEKRAQAATQGDWLVQLGLYGSLPQARNAWQVLNVTHQEIFRGLAAEYRAINTGGQSLMLMPGRQEINTGYDTMHLLAVGRFSAEEEAVAVCSSLQSSGGHCFVVNYRPVGAGASPPVAALTGQQKPVVLETLPHINEPGPTHKEPSEDTREPSAAGKVIVWGGIDVSGRSYYSYAGSVQSLSGRNIHTQNGFLIRESVGYGDYRFKKTGVIGDVTGTVKTADISLGYKFAFKNGGIATYVGGSLENHDRSANDAGNDVIGTNAGFIASTDAQIRLSDRVSLLGMASYASANQSYWTHFAAGYGFDAGKAGRVTLGPTLGFSGGPDYDIQRYGVSLADINVGFASMYVYTGYSVSSNDENNNVYGGLGFGKSF